MSKRAWTRLLPALSFVLLAPGLADAQGILLLAHGGPAEWNQEVLALASRVDASVPIRSVRRTFAGSLVHARVSAA